MLNAQATTVPNRLFTALACALSLASFLPRSAQANDVLDCWGFSDTNWISWQGNAPIASTNLINVAGGGDGNCLLLDTTNASPAYLLYNTFGNSATNVISLTNGTVSVWFSPDWSSADQTNGTGPGDFANLLSMGQFGAGGSGSWGLYLSADGTSLSFAAMTNGDETPTTFVTAQVSLTQGVWNNLVMTYCTTNSSFYLNGQSLTNGAGVTVWPGPEVSLFSIGSDTNGFYQARGMFDNLITYDYPLPPNLVFMDYQILASILFGSPAANSIAPAPSSPTNTPTFNAITGPGYLQFITNAANCISNSNVWITNVVATPTNGAMKLIFTIAGGVDGAMYDVFANAVIAPVSGTNVPWAWVGQGPHCATYSLTLTNPPSSAFLILGTPLDSDSDGLTDAYELLVSKSDPHRPDSGGDGMLDGWKVLWGLDPSINNVARSGERSGFTYDLNGWLEILAGVRTEGISLDDEGNVKSSQ